MKVVEGGEIINSRTSKQRKIDNKRVRKEEEKAVWVSKERVAAQCSNLFETLEVDEPRHDEGLLAKPTFNLKRDNLG